MMLINKIFHLRQPVAEARQRLREPGTWNGLESDPDMGCSTIKTEGGRFEFSTRQGQRLSAKIEEVPGDDPNQILFRSAAGNVELAGIIELYPIRPNLTEVVLTVDYVAVSPLQKAFEALDRFLNRQLLRIEGCMERARSARTTNGASVISGRFA